MTQIRFGPSGPQLLPSPATFTTSSDQFLEEYAAAVSRKAFFKFGRNPTIAQAVTADVWTGAPTSLLYPGWLTTPERIRAISDSAEDAPGGAGAHALALFPHTPEFSWHDFDDPILLPMNGTSLTALTDDEFIRCTGAIVASCGTYTNGASTGNNVGTISILTESGILLGQIDPAIGTSEQFHLTVPANSALWVRQARVSVNDQQPANVAGFGRQAADVVTGSVSPALKIASVTGAQGVNQIPYDYQLRISEKTDVWARATAGTAATEVTVELTGVLLYF